MSTGRENHREDVVGRANVEDTPELLAYYDQLDGFNAGALWTVANKIEPWQPTSQSVPRSEEATPASHYPAPAQRKTPPLGRGSETGLRPDYFFAPSALNWDR